METNRLVRVLDVSQYTEYGMPVLLAIFLLAFMLPLSVQADANDDFVVQRGVAVITGTSTTLVAGVDYNAPSASTSAFIRITNTHHTGAGPDTGSGDANAIDATAYVVDPGNVETSVTIARPGSVNANTRVAWELVEYQGMLGGENEMIVREQRALTYDPASTTAAGPAVSNILADDDIVVFITGQFSPDEGSDDFNAVLSTASWDANSDRPLFERGEAGGDAVRVSYAIIEFTGSNWNVARVPDHVYTEAGVTETSAIAPVGSLTRAFIHTQKRVGPGLNTHADIRH